MCLQASCNGQVVTVISVAVSHPHASSMVTHCLPFLGRKRTATSCSARLRGIQTESPWKRVQHHVSMQADRFIRSTPMYCRRDWRCAYVCRHPRPRTNAHDAAYGAFTCGRTCTAEQHSTMVSEYVVHDTVAYWAESTTCTCHVVEFTVSYVSCILVHDD